MSEESETLYVTNLNDRVKVGDLKTLLYELFAGYGEVVAVQVLRGKMNAQNKPIRGTAFVTLRTVVQASMALRNAKNFPLLGKPLHVQFAKAKSDELAKLHGTYKPKYKPRRILVDSKSEK
jgi:U2 small nuclear ribonucleoprotein B''